MRFLTGRYYAAMALVTVVLIQGSKDAHAITTGGYRSGSNDFSTIARNITYSIEEIPGLVSGVSYLIGLLLGVQGILKLKDHVESPQDEGLKGGATHLLAGGSLFALPIIYEAMGNTIGVNSGAMATMTPILNSAAFNVR